MNYFVIIQANEVGSSYAMELEGAKRSFNFLKGSGLKIDIFIKGRRKVDKDQTERNKALQ